MAEQETLNLLLNGMEAANEKLDELMQWKATFEERSKNQGVLIDDMRQTLYDNPSGLVSTVQRLYSCKNEVNRERIQWKNFFLDILKRVIVWAIIALIVWGMYLYKYS